MKEVMIAIQPYWVFLIIARKMGWKIDKEKTIEVRKKRPQDENWNRQVEIYCSKDKKSFNKIPKEYQPLMQKFLGKVIGEFTCDRIDISVVELKPNEIEPCYWKLINGSCLTKNELMNYGKYNALYGWHISDLVIYDKPRELSEFRLPCTQKQCASWCKDMKVENAICLNKGKRFLTRPPQSWCYVESLGEWV